MWTDLWSYAERAKQIDLILKDFYVPVEGKLLHSGIPMEKKLAMPATQSISQESFSEDLKEKHENTNAISCKSTIKTAP